jgi:hypothetical protein
MKIIFLILLWCLIAAISAPIAVLSLALVFFVGVICLPFWIIGLLFRSVFGLFFRRPRRCSCCR